jgi:helix-turn-helix protein
MMCQSVGKPPGARYLHYRAPSLVQGEPLSFKALAWAFEQGIKNPEKAVLIALAYRDNHDYPHGCFPSLARMAEDCGLHSSTVVRCLDELQNLGLVKRTRRRDEKGDAASTFYTLPMVWGVIAHSDNRVIAHSDNGSRPQRQPVIAHSDTNLKGTVIEPTATNPAFNVEETRMQIHTRALANRAIKEQKIERPKTSFERAAEVTAEAAERFLRKAD